MAARTAFHASGVLVTAMEMLLELKQHSRGLVVAVGLPCAMGGWYL
jgi:hypothetical protein